MNPDDEKVIARAAEVAEVDAKYCVNMEFQLLVAACTVADGVEPESELWRELRDVYLARFRECIESEIEDMRSRAPILPEEFFEHVRRRTALNMDRVQRLLHGNPVKQKPLH